MNPQNPKMPSHPNRSLAGSQERNPAPEEVRAAREAAGLSQTEAARVIHCTLRGWQEWEAGNRKMHPAFWELFRIKSAL